MPVPPVSPRAGCSKKMVYGPCGGVRPDASCELVATPCVFVDGPAAPPVPRPTVAPVAVRAPLVLTDLSVPPADAVTLARTARRLAPSCDALLVGDHQDRADLPPSTLARLLADAGTHPWVTLACRDRDRLSLQTELQALRQDGVATVLCVTGDGRAYDICPDRDQVFDLDSIRLAGLASGLGLPVAVAETPSAPPVALRPQRLVAKQQAGAGVAVLNHVRSADRVAAFVGTARRLGLTMPVVASVAVYTDERSAAALTRLPGLELDPAAVAAVLGAPDPVSAGIAAALAEAAALLAVPGVVGVNLSGMASGRGVDFAAGVQVEIGQRLRAREHAVTG